MHCSYFFLHFDPLAPDSLVVIVVYGTIIVVYGVVCHISGLLQCLMLCFKRVSFDEYGPDSGLYAPTCCGPSSWPWPRPPPWCAGAPPPSGGPGRAPPGVLCYGSAVRSCRLSLNPHQSLQMCFYLFFTLIAFRLPFCI